MSKYDLICILGHTAGGKTTVAAHLAYRLGSEVISADSRQVYRRMDLGTGKDFADYIVNDKPIPYRLIDIAEPGEKYNVFKYQQDFSRVYHDIRTKGKVPILCGGTGLYLESVLKRYKMTDVPVNEELRNELEKKDLPELEQILASKKQLHNSTDTDTKERAIRGIEIAVFYEKNPDFQPPVSDLNCLTIGIKFDRASRRRRISQRLKERMEDGMLEEVEALLSEGISPEQLIYYGLEYKYMTLHLTGEMDYDEMYMRLEIAIHQFAKRQMTWFRKMERQGIEIHWLDGYQPLAEKLEQIEFLFNKDE